jgi:TonB family protein
MMTMRFRSRGVFGLAVVLAALSRLLVADAKPAPEAEMDLPPKLIRSVVPMFPFSMKMAGVGGRVDLEYTVDSQGRVTNPYVIASNNPWFERPAIEAVLKWQYTPGRKFGQAVDTRVRQQVVFTMESDSGNNRGEDLWRTVKPRDHDKLPLEIRWDKAPIPVASSYPVYPLEALREGRKGRAVVRILVNPSGGIEVGKVIEASAPEFAGSALASIDAWQFKPARRGAEPCSALLQLEFEFKPNQNSDVPVSDSMWGIVRELGRKEPHIFDLDKLDAVPKALSRRPPVYPSALRKAGQPGEAVIEFFIDQSGDAQLPGIVSATTPEFGYAAAQAVATWRFEPPTKEGKPVIARVRIPVTFRLQSEAIRKPEPAPKEKQP